MRISTGVTPSGGWKFKQGDYWIISETWNNLVSDLTTHRKSNKLPEGNPVEDIQDQLLGLYPSLKVNVIKMKSNAH